MVDIVPAHVPEMLESVRLLFAEFADGGGADLASPEFLREIAGLPGEYAPPTGRLLVAYEAAHLAGCGALRGSGGGAASLMRVYVREEYRNEMVERALVQRLLREAAVAGYSAVECDPADSMRGLTAYLTEAGFTETDGVLRLEL